MDSEFILIWLLRDDRYYSELKKAAIPLLWEMGRGLSVCQTRVGGEKRGQRIGVGERRCGKGRGRGEEGRGERKGEEGAVGKRAEENASIIPNT